MATDVEARLELLEAERAITRTLHRYAHSIDYGDEEAWVDCFTEDGVFIARHTRAPELWHKHLLVEPAIDVEGDTASCVSYLAVVMEHDDMPVLRVFGRYRDRLERGDDGRWRFRERIAEIESMRADLPPFVDGRPGTSP
jgi:ketosteroid isomerase-like protein